MGLTGRLTKAFLGSEAMGQLQESVQAAQDAQIAQHAAAAGVVMTPATVAALQDTGKLINYDPVVVLTLVLANGQQFAMETLVSKLQIPRVGDRIGLMPHPQAPGQYLYCGPYMG